MKQSSSLRRAVTLCSILFVSGALLLVAGCRGQNPKPAPSGLRYVAVGDSYSAGTGATPEQSWPALLARDLTAQGRPVYLAANPSYNGATSFDAIRRELPVLNANHPEFATLMIGVNDTYKTTPASAFKRNLDYLLDQMQKTMPAKGRIVVVTIPDFAVTPAGAGYARLNNAAVKTVDFNKIIFEEASKRSMPVVDVYELSQAMATDSKLLADDHLHPSAPEYAAWEARILPVALRAIK